MKKQIVCTLLAFSVLTGCGNTAATGRTGSNTPTVTDVLNNGLEEYNAQTNGSTGTTSGGNTPVVATPEPTVLPGISGDSSDTANVGNDPASGSSDGSVSSANDTGEEMPDLSATEGIDVDLTLLSSTMVYSEVYNMMYLPEDYVGKVVKMEGTYMVYRDETTGSVYRCCIIQDATACCAQGIEFIPDNPENCPEEGDIVTVVGTFDTYMEGENLYCTLKDANVL